MPLALLTCCPMTSDRGLVGADGVRRWDLSFLDPPPPPPPASQPTFWSPRDGFWSPAPNSQSDVISSVGRRHVIIPHPTTGNAGGFRTNTGSGNDAPLPSQHFYQNVGREGDDVDRLTKVTIEEEEDSVRFFLPVVNSPRTAVPPHSTPPWLTVTPSGSEADTGSRSESIGSQDSLVDLDCLGLRIRDDSGIGMTAGGSDADAAAAALPRRNSSAPVLNDLIGVVVSCRPSPSPLGRTVVEGHRRRRRRRRPDEDLSPPPTHRPPPMDSDCSGAYMKIARFLPSWDLERLSTVFRHLGICRFYLGRLSFDEAKFLLRGFPVGTFLLRDSSDARFLFSLSVQTTRGTTSIRVVYEAGNFRLDCEPEQVHLMPTFDCVVRLVRHYIHLATNFSQRGMRNNFVFLEATGRRDTPVLLRRPWANRPSALRHLCRLRINALLGCSSSSSSSSSAVDRLYLIPSLKGFLKDYPYDI